MGSATSFFNSTIYRKTMARYWPLWDLYGVIWVFCIPLFLMTSYFNTLRWSQVVSRAQDELLSRAMELPDLLEFGLFLSAGFGVLAAMAAFGYLYNNRSACTIHALPVRREALFWSNYLAGLSFLLLPRRAAALMGAAVELALDAGVLLGGGREAALCEVEVELKSGTEKAVSAYGEWLAGEFGLVPEKKSKFRRALALAEG